MTHNLLFLFILSFFLIHPLAAQDFRPGDHELMVMPSGETIPEGQSYFGSYELMLMNYTYAPVEHLQVGVFTIFPVTADFLESITVGAKYQLYRSENLHYAGYVSYALKPGLFLFGNTLTFPFTKSKLHLGISALGVPKESDHIEGLVYAGYETDITEKLTFIIEYANATTALKHGFNGFAIIGIKFRSESIAWELGGGRPLMDTEDDFLFFPVLKATFHF